MPFFRRLSARHRPPRRPFGTSLLIAVLALGCSGPDDPGGNNAVADAGADAADHDAGPNLIPGELGLISLTPHRGPLRGGDEIDVYGQEFDEQTQVWFGEQQAEVNWRSGSTHLYVVAPAAFVPGRVAIKAVDAAGATAVLSGGFTYVGEVGVDDVTPLRGPHTGGTVIEVKGTGFLPGDRVLVGFRECSDSQVTDTHTIVATTPAATFAADQVTQNVIVSVRHASGVSNLAKSFTYGRPPTVDRVAPPIVPKSGAAAILHGLALGHADVLFAGDILAELADGTASSSRGAALPAYAALSAGHPLAVPLLIDGPYGHTRLSPAYAYEQGKPALHGLTPATGTADGGTDVAMIMEFAGAAVTAVTFGGAAVAHVVKDGVLFATTSKHAPGPVDVVVTTDKGELKLAPGFTFFATPQLINATPNTGPTAGGTDVQIAGKGLSADCEVRIGAHLASIKDASSTGFIVVTPPGAPGAVDITVTCGGLQASLLGGFGYTTGTVRINALSPSSGATGGDTLVTIYGAGFTHPPKVFFGGKQANSVEVLDSGRIRLKTPAHAPGPVAVDVVLGEQHDTLLDGYSYFSPANPRGGTYGEPTEGTLNVTVLNIYSLQPIENAWVQLGEPGSSQFAAYPPALTNADGQVVFSGPDIAPPLTVSAAKQEFSASSIVHFGVANATVLLFPWVPPSPGNGNPGPGLPAARIEGTVLDLDKYVWGAPSNCLKPPGQPNNPQCDFCELTDECTQTAAKDGDTHKWQCAITGASGKRCFHYCDSDQDCMREDFSCVADLLEPDKKVCKPSLGIRHIECTTSCRGLSCAEPPTSQIPPKQPPVGVVDEKTGKYALDPVRLDELAVVCRAGYIANASNAAEGIKKGAFIAYQMGVKRHIFPQVVDGQVPVIKGVDVRMNIQLRRTLHARLANPPKSFPTANSPGRIKLQAWLELGSDGYIPLADIERNPLGKESGVHDVEILYRQPLALPIELTATSNVYRAVARFGPDTPTAPESGTLHDDVLTSGDVNLRIRGASGQYTDGTIAINTSIAGVLEGAPGDLLFATRNGRVYRGTLSDPYLIWLPPDIDPYTPPAVVMAVAGTPTDATLVGQAGLIRRLLGDDVAQEKGVLVEDLLVVGQGDEFRVVVGAKGGLAVAIDGAGAGKSALWQQVTAATTGALRAVACEPGGAVAVGDGGVIVHLSIGSGGAVANVTKEAGGLDLYAVARTTLGQLWIGGAGTPGLGGTLLRRIGDKWVSAWPAGFNPKDVPNIRHIIALDGATVLATDADDGVWRVGPSGVSDESAERRDLNVLCGLLTSGGDVFLAGQPGLWLGPFLTVPNISKPLGSGNPKQMQVEWAVAPGPSPSLNRVHLDGDGFPFWWLYTAPATTSVTLPDFTNVPSHTPTVFLDANYTARVDRIYMPDLHIDGFSTFDVEFGSRRSWSTNYRAFGL